MKDDDDGTGLGKIKSTTDRAIGVYDGVFTNFNPGGLEISDLADGRGFNTDRSFLEIGHLDIIGNDSINEHLVSINISKFYIRNINISNSGKNRMNIHGSSGSIDIISIQESKQSGLYIDGSIVNIEKAIIGGNDLNGIEVKNNSSLRG